MAAALPIEEDADYIYDEYDSSEQIDPVVVALQTSFSVRPYRCLGALPHCTLLRFPLFSFRLRL